MSRAHRGFDGRLNLAEDVALGGSEREQVRLAHDVGEDLQEPRGLHRPCFQQTLGCLPAVAVRGEAAVQSATSRRLDAQLEPWAIRDEHLGACAVQRIGRPVHRGLPVGPKPIAMSVSAVTLSAMIDYQCTTSYLPLRIGVGPSVDRMAAAAGLQR